MSKNIRVIEDYQGRARTDGLSINCPVNGAPEVIFRRGIYRLKENEEIGDYVYGESVQRSIDTSLLLSPAEVVTVVNPFTQQSVDVPLVVAMLAVQAFGDKWHTEDREAK